MDDDQQFCLRWNNHQSTLVSVFDNLLEKGMHVDCTLAAEGQTLKAHKVVLSACSPYFESVLSQQYDKHPIIILKDVKYAELRAMMDYMYRGEVNISQDQLAALLKAAESLQIKGLSDNKPSRPPSRPAQAAPAHPPRAPSPPPQPRDGSIDSREGSVSPTRRRKKARRMSNDGPPTLSLPPPNDNAQGNGDDQPQCKEEVQRDGVEDLTLDEECDDQPAVAHNDVVRNFQWHMERSQDDMMNSNDGARESQEVLVEMLNTNYAKTPFPLTRGYFKNNDINAEDEDKELVKKKIKKILKKKLLSGQRRANKKLDGGISEGMCQTDKRTFRTEKGRIIKGNCRSYRNKCLSDKDSCRNDKEIDRLHVCSICKKKQYKYRRNQLRHEKYECNTGPQFSCDVCGKKYSQKKTVAMHVALKHPKKDP